MQEYERYNQIPMLLSSEACPGARQTAVNAVTRATLGLRTLHDTVGAGRKRGRTWETVKSLDLAVEHDTLGRFSTPSMLAVSGKVSLFGKRYIPRECIGEGTFARVIRADDTFRQGRSVAVKIMHRRWEAIGRREIRCMRFLNSVPLGERSPVVRLLHAFIFGENLCLVMELLDESLVSYTMAGRVKRGPGQYSMLSARDGQSNDLVGSLRWVRGENGDSESPRTRAPGIRPALKRPLAGVGWVKGGPAPRYNSLHASGQETRREDDEAGPSGIPVEVIRNVALQLVRALQVLRDHGFVHADIKPANVLLTTDEAQNAPMATSVEELMRGGVRAGTTRRRPPSTLLLVKLCDFGNAIRDSEARHYYQNEDFEIQTLAYRAPEVLMECPFGPAIDTWSVGLVLLELVLGRCLFHTASSREALLRQMTCALGPLPSGWVRLRRCFEDVPGRGSTPKYMKGDRAEAKTVGCCSCCWMGIEQEDRVSIETIRRCTGYCALTCRRPHTYQDLPETKVVGQSRVHKTSPAAGSQPASSMAGLKRGAPVKPEPRHGRSVHAHLSRLINGGNSRPFSYLDMGYTCRSPRSNSVCSSNRGDGHMLSFLAGLLSFDPKERFSPAQALAHPFLRQSLPLSLPPANAGIPFHSADSSTEASSVASSCTPSPAALRVPLPRGIPPSPAQGREVGTSFTSQRTSPVFVSFKTPRVSETGDVKAKPNPSREKTVPLANMPSIRPNRYLSSATLARLKSGLSETDVNWARERTGLECEHQQPVRQHTSSVPSDCASGGQDEFEVNLHSSPLPKTSDVQPTDGETLSLVSSSSSSGTSCVVRRKMGNGVRARQHNRFLTPAVLAILKPDPEHRTIRQRSVEKEETESPT